MAVQELKTQLVFEASNAIKSLNTLQEALNKVAHVDFKQVADGFREMAKAVETVRKQTGDAVTKAVETQLKAIEELKRKAEQQTKDLIELEKKTVRKANEQAARELKAIDAAKKQAATEEKAKLKAQEEEIKNLQKLALLTMQLRELENKALGGLNKKIFQQNDFDAVERRLTSVAQKIERIKKDANITVHVGAFVDFLKGINTKNYEAKARQAAEEQARKAYEARGTALIKAHGQQMNKMFGDLTVGKTDELKKDQQILSSITREIARIYIELGKANVAAGYFKQALNLANNRKEFKAMLEDISAFRQQQNIKDRAWNAAGLDSRIKAYRAMRQEMQSDPFIATASATKLDRYKREMAELAASIAQIYKETGEAAKGIKYLEDAFRTVEGHKGLQKRYADELAALKTFVKQQELALKRVNEGVWGSPEWKAKQVEKQRFLAEQARKRALQSAAEKKEEEERVKRYERLARLAGRIADIQSKINGRFSIGKPFTENEFVKIRNQLHNIGLEMDKISGKNVSGYLSYILDGVRVKNTPSTNATAQKLSDQYNDVRKKAEEAATQFAKTKSIADAIRFNAAMKDLQAITKETETVNRLLGRTQGFFERITNLLSRRMRWHFGDELIRSAMSFPSELFQNYRDLEQAMAGVQQVMPLIEGQPKQVFAETESLIEIANDFARTAQEVVEGA